MELQKYEDFLDIGNALDDLKKYDEAISQYNKAIEINPNYADAYYNKAIVLKNLQKYEEAIQQYDKAIQINPNYAAAYNNKGIVLKNLQKYEEAIQQYDKAIQINPNYTVAYNNKGLVLNNIQKYEEAIQQYDKAIQINPNYAAAYYNKGSSLDDLKKYDEAISQYNKAIEINPNYADAYYNKAIVLNNLQKYEEAIQQYDKAIQINPNYADAYNNKGIVLKNLQKYEDAIQQYDKAIKINPKNILAFVNIATTYMKIDKYSDAYHNLKIAYSLKNDPQAIQGLSEGNMLHIENSLEQIIELNKIFEETQQIIQIIQQKPNDDKNNSQNLLKVFQGLEQQKISFIYDNINNFEKNLYKSQSFEQNEQNIKYRQIVKQFEDFQSQIFKQFEDLQSQLKKNEDNIEKKIEKIEDQLEKGGVIDRAYVKDGFHKLQKDSPKLYEYCQSFYWSLLNYLNAYKNISTGLQQNNLDNDQNMKEEIFANAAKKIANYGADLAKGLPVVGGILGLMDSIIDDISVTIKDIRFQNKANAINKVFMFNSDKNINTQEDLSICIAKLSLRVTDSKREEILNPKPELDHSNLNKAKKYFEDKIKNLKTYAFGKQIDLYESKSATMALEDIILLMAYIQKNYQIMINKQDSIEEQLYNIIISGKSYVIIEDLEQSTMIQVTPIIETQSGCCSVFSLLKIKYTLPLLNCPQLLEYAANRYKLNEIFMLSQKLNIYLLDEICSQGDVDLLLAALISIDE